MFCCFRAPPHPRKHVTTTMHRDHLSKSGRCGSAIAGVDPNSKRFHPRLCHSLTTPHLGDMYSCRCTLQTHAMDHSSGHMSWLHISFGVFQISRSRTGIIWRKSQQTTFVQTGTPLSRTARAHNLHFREIKPTMGEWRLIFNGTQDDVRYNERVRGWPSRT